MSAQNLPVAVLEERASQERQELHESINELRSGVRKTLRKRLAIQAYVSKHFWPAAAAVSLVALLFGYGGAGLFTRR